MFAVSGRFTVGSVSELYDPVPLSVLVHDCGTGARVIGVQDLIPVNLGIHPIVYDLLTVITGRTSCSEDLAVYILRIYSVEGRPVGTGVGKMCADLISPCAGAASHVLFSADGADPCGGALLIDLFKSSAGLLLRRADMCKYTAGYRKGKEEGHYGGL